MGARSNMKLGEMHRTRSGINPLWNPLGLFQRILRHSRPSETRSRRERHRVGIDARRSCPRNFHGNSFVGDSICIYVRIIIYVRVIR